MNALGWYSLRDITNQCSECFWLLTEHKMACCEFDRQEFPKANHCSKFQKDKDDNGQDVS